MNKIFFPSFSFVCVWRRLSESSVAAIELNSIVQSGSLEKMHKCIECIYWVAAVAAAVAVVAAAVAGSTRTAFFWSSTQIICIFFHCISFFFQNTFRNSSIARCALNVEWRTWRCSKLKRPRLALHNKPTRSLKSHLSMQHRVKLDGEPVGRLDGSMARPNECSTVKW